MMMMMMMMKCKITPVNYLNFHGSECIDQGLLEYDAV